MNLCSLAEERDIRLGWAFSLAGSKTGWVGGFGAIWRGRRGGGEGNMRPPGFSS